MYNTNMETKLSFIGRVNIDQTKYAHNLGFYISMMTKRHDEAYFEDIIFQKNHEMIIK